MERFVFRALPKEYTEDDILKSLNLPEDIEPEDREEVYALIRAAEAIADPKAVLRVSRVTEHGADFVSIDGVRIDCALMAENFRSVYRVFPYVCTCGTEIEDWSHSLTDPLLAYWADRIKLFYAGAVQKHLFRHVREQYLPAGHLSHMNPGSLSQWPISEQAVLFSVIGDVRETIGVTLTESYLMLPAKSTSGILFASETAYENCMLCPMPDCPGRRAPYIKNNT